MAGQPPDICRLRQIESVRLSGTRSSDEGLALYGLIALSQGSLLVSMIWGAALAHMLDRRFLRAAG